MSEAEDAVMPPLDRLKQLLDAQQVKLGVHIRKMNSPGSPVYRTWENVWPAALVLGASFAGTAAVHFYLGGVILLGGCWWWLAKVQPRVKDGVFERTSLWALQSDAHFDGLWAKGVLSLYAELPDGRKLAATWRDDWRAFARQVARETGATPIEDAA
jgi:hypothetical protein